METLLKIQMNPPMSLMDFRLEAEREYFRNLLDLREKNGWTMAKIGAICGLRRRHVHQKLKALGLTTETARELSLRWGGIK